MKIRSHRPHIPEALEASLAAFEKSFSYPLGATTRFRISHGEDYLAFFRAMGEAVAVLAEREEEVAGCIVRVLRRLDRDGIDHGVVHYLCDLKVRQDVWGTATLAGLIRETKSGIEASGTTACYCVVMEGTGRLPTDYTGRLGVPPFVKVAEIVVLRLSMKGEAPAVACRVTDEDGFPRMTMPGYRVTGGDRTLRSLMEPIRLVAPDGGACGLLEDTRKAKRLFLESGGELVSAHVSSFAYRNAAAGARVLVDAVTLASLADVPAVFVAVPRTEVARLLPELEGLQVLQAPASVFAHGVEAGCDWWIDTAEI